MVIPFNRPSLEGSELAYMRAAVELGDSAAKGPFSQRVSELLAAHHGAADVLLTTSCTAALELSALLLDVGPEDTVIVPSFTFVTTALAYARAGARLVFADIEPDTLGIDPAHVAELVDDTTRAVVPVHYAGVGCRMQELGEALAGHERVDVVEDNAHGLFGAIDDVPLGTFGRFSTLSFHETKNFVCGEGGALVLNDPADVDRAHVLYDKGTNRRAFFAGQVDKYRWVDTGSSFGMSDLLAAYLLAQLEARDAVLAKRRALHTVYEEALAPHAATHGYRTPVIPDDRTQAYHMYYLLLPDARTRDAALEGLAEAGYRATFHYVPLHDAPGAKAHLAHPTDCPVTDDVSSRLLRLPFYNDLDHATATAIADRLLTLLDALH